MFTIYSADCSNQSSNCSYPNRNAVSDAASLKKAVRRDYVCAEYRNLHRSNANFLRTDCLGVDCDNDFSEDPDSWVTAEDIRAAFPEVEFGIHFSRNHMAVKDGHPARPKFHVLFRIRPEESPAEYAALKVRLNNSFPIFDPNALDAARFFYGTDDPQVLWFPGDKTLNEFLDENADFDAVLPQGSYGELVIPEGRRNSTLSRLAAQLLKKYGDGDSTHGMWLELADGCTPPLEEKELNTIWKSALKLYRRIASQPGYIRPEEYNGLYTMKPDDYSDIGQAKVLARECRETLIYADAYGYLRYDGVRWSDSDQKAVGLCESFLDRQLKEAQAAAERTRRALVESGVPESAVNAGKKELEKAIDANSQAAYNEHIRATQYLAFVMKRRDMKYISSALQAARPMLLQDLSVFDSQEFLLNTPDATYDLQHGMDGRREHRAEDKLTKVTAVSPDDRNMDMWLAALDDFFCEDKDLIDYVQQIVGLAAIGNVYVEALVIAYGQGRNGKSTFWNTLASVLGDYSGSLSADALTSSRRRNIRPEMAELRGKRLVIAAELEDGVRLSTSVIKQLCSTDEIPAEKKYKDPFEFTPTHTLVLYTNHLPRVSANDEGTWRRLIVIPFNAVIEGSADIKNYSDHLIEYAGGAVLQWIIEGAQKIINRNFHLDAPKCVQEATGRYREANNWMAQFIEEYCDVGKEYVQSSGELYRKYQSCCSRGRGKSTSEFYDELERAGFERKKTKHGSFVYGLQLRQFEPEVPDCTEDCASDNTVYDFLE